MKKLAAFLLATLLVFSLFSCGKKENSNIPDVSSQTAVTEGFKAPDSYAAIIKIKINPEFNLYIDVNGKVLALEAVNSDAQSIMDDITYEGQGFEAAIKSIIAAANKGGFAKDKANVSFELTEAQNTSTNSTDVLNKASDAVKSAAGELKINLTVSITRQSGNDAQGTASTESKPTTSQKPTTSTPAASKPTTSTPTTSQKPTSSEPPKTEEPAFLNPKTNLPYDKEYAGNYRPEGDHLISSGFAFYKEGGMDGGAFCLLLTQDFEPTQTDPNQVMREYKGKKYYCIGAGQTPHNMELTDTEIIVKNSFYDEAESISFKLTLKPNNTFVVTYSQMPEYPVGTVLSYLRG